LCDDDDDDDDEALNVWGAIKRDPHFTNCLRRLFVETGTNQISKFNLQFWQSDTRILKTPYYGLFFSLEKGCRR
jgi:hypothetical protein